MADLNSGDLFAINRGGEDYKASLGDLVRYLTKEEPFQVVSNSSWVSSDDEFIDGATCTAKTATFAGGSALSNSFRYRWQTNDSTKAWANTGWTYYDNTAIEVESPELIGGQQIKLQCQAVNSSDSVPNVNSFSATKTIETVTLPWEGHDGGIFHITNVSETIYLVDEVTAWDVNGRNERIIEEIQAGEELVFVASDDDVWLFNYNDGTWDFGKHTDIRNLTTMEGMFAGCTAFNADISGWDVSNVTDMSFMFHEASTFNVDISSWNVRKVTNMLMMFDAATSFNADISGWDVYNVTDMNSTFNEASKFNADISVWDVSSVTDMTMMFTSATSFNADISGWDVSNVTEMDYMFADATAFNRDLSQWCVNPEPSHTEFDKGAFSWSQSRPNWGTCPGRDPEYPQPWLDLSDKYAYFEVIVTEEDACTVGTFSDIWNAENGDEVSSFSLHEGRGSKPQRRKDNERLLAHKQAWLEKNPDKLTEEETEAFLKGDRLPKSLQSTFSYYYYYYYGSSAATLKPGRYIISYDTNYKKIEFGDSQGDFQLGETADFKGDVYARNMYSTGEDKNGHNINSFFTNAQNFSNKGQPLPKVWREYLERCWPKGLNGLFNNTNFNEDLRDLNTFNQDPLTVIQFGNKGTDPVWGTDPKGVATKPTTPEKFNMKVWNWAGGDLSISGPIKNNTLTLRESHNRGEGSLQADYKFVSERIKVGDEVLLADDRWRGPWYNDYDNGKGGNVDHICRVVDVGLTSDGWWQYWYLTLEGIDGYSDPNFKKDNYHCDLWVDGWAYREEPIPTPWLDLYPNYIWFEFISTEDDAVSISGQPYKIWNSATGEKVYDQYGRTADNERLLAHKKAWLAENPTQLTEQQAQAFLEGEHLPDHLQSSFSYYDDDPIDLPAGQWIIGIHARDLDIEFRESKGDFELTNYADFKGQVWARNMRGDHRTSFFANAKNFSNKGKPLPQVWRDLLESAWPKGINLMFENSKFSDDLSDLNTFNQDPKMMIGFGNNGTNPAWGTDPNGGTTEPTGYARFILLAWYQCGIMNWDMSPQPDRKTTLFFDSRDDEGPGGMRDLAFLENKLTPGEIVVLSKDRSKGTGYGNDYESPTGGNIDTVLKVKEVGQCKNQWNTLFVYITFEGHDGYSVPDFSDYDNGGKCVYVDAWKYRE